MNVPILDLTRTHRRIARPLAERWQRTLETSSFILGPEVKELEAGFASLLGATGCVGVANGTDALVIALRALGLQPGDEVLVPAYSFFATAEAVMLLGGRPVFVDVDADTCNLDARDAASRVTARTVGVIAVHLYGRPFDVPAIQGLCDRHGLWLLEDAAQAHGAALGGRRVGTFGRLAAWSFYPTKNLGCFGDGGAITGMDRGLLDHVFRLANHGQAERYRHLEVGTNSRLDSLQAAVLNCRLPDLDGDNARRREIAGRYQAALAATDGVRFPVDPADSVCVYHQAALFSAQRDELQRRLAAAGVASALHYPSPLHRQPAVVAAYGELPDLPVASRLAREVLCLPVFPELTNEEVERVIVVLHESLREIAGA